MNKRLIADRADILKNGYEDLVDVINDSSEDAVKEDFFSVIKKNFPAKTFVEATLKQGAATQNEINKETLMNKLPQYLKDTAHLYYQKFYKKRLIDDEIACEPKDKIFKQAVEKFSSEIVLNEELGKMVEDAINDESVQERYFKHEEKPKEKEKPKDKKQNDEELSYEDEIEQTVKKRGVIPFGVLKDLDEPVGTTGIPIMPVDVGRRDYPFIVMDNSIFVKGTSKDSHSTALHKWAEKHKDDKTELGKKLKEIYDENDDDWYRHNAIGALAQAGVTKLVFGHVRDDMAFIDTCDGCTADDVKSVVKNGTGVSKVYDVTKHMSYGAWSGVRVARLIPNYNKEMHNSAIEEMKKFKH